MLNKTKLAQKVFRYFGYEIIATKAALPREVKGDYDLILDSIGQYSFKFLDVKTFLPMTIQRAHFLGLHASPSLDIMDIGTGVGYFPVVCKHYGHTAIAIDRDGNEVFMDATRWLNVDRRSCEIKAFQNVPPQGQRFDLITAFMVNFDRYEPPDYKPWGTTEWDFFLTDMARNHLKQDGRLALLLNGHTLDVPTVMQHFIAKGAHRQGAWVDFRSLSAYQ